MNGFSKGVVAGAKNVSEVIYENFSCAAGSSDLENSEVQILGPLQSGNLSLVSTNTIVLRFGQDYEKKFLVEGRGFSGKADKYKKVVSSEVAKITYEKFDRKSKQTKEGVLYFYQEIVRTALNAYFTSVSDEKFRALTPNFGVSYVNISENSNLILASGSENLEIGKVTSSEQLNQIIGESFGLEEHVKQLFSFKFVPHEIIGEFCEHISKIISKNTYINSYNYYDINELNPKHLKELYDFVTSDKEPKSEDAKKVSEDLTPEKIFNKIINFIFPSERIVGYEEGDTIKSGFCTIVKDRAYFKTPKISSQDIFVEDDNFSFSDVKKVLLFSYKITAATPNSIVLPYVYDKNRFEVQKLKEIFPISDEYALFSSKPDMFNYSDSNLDIINGSFDKYVVVLSVCDVAGLEDFKYPLLTMPHRSSEDKKNKKVERAFVDESEDVSDGSSKFRNLPEEHYSFENGNIFSDVLPKDYLLPAEGYLSKSTSKVFFFKTQSSRVFVFNDVYETKRDDLGFVYIPLKSYGSNLNNVSVKIDKKSLKGVIPERYKERIILNVKAYLRDEFGQIYPIIRKFKDPVSKTTKASNLYRIFLKKPKISSLDLSFGDGLSEDSFTLDFAGEDLEFTTKVVLLRGSEEVTIFEMPEESVSLDGKRILRTIEQNFFSDVLQVESFSGEVSFKVIIQDPLGYDSEVESNIISKKINFESDSDPDVNDSFPIQEGDINPVLGAESGE